MLNLANILKYNIIRFIKRENMEIDLNVKKLSDEFSEAQIFKVDNKKIVIYNTNDIEILI